MKNPRRTPLVRNTIWTVLMAIGALPAAQAEASNQCPPVSLVKPNTSYSCSFPNMPLYNQLDPNLAFVNVPEATYQVELSEGLVGNIAGLQSGTPAWYFPQSWLPLGPAIGDPDSIGYTYSVTCGGTAEAMAYMAAIDSRSPSNVINPASWTASTFVDATQPGWEYSFPEPLLQTNVAGAAQMDLVGLKRLVNMFSLTNTVPAAGWYPSIGNSYWPYYLSFQPFANDFSQASYYTLTSWNAVEGYSNSASLSTSVLRGVINGGGTGVFHHTQWQVNITPVASPKPPCTVIMSPLGKPVGELCPPQPPPTYDAVTFTQVPESHYLALRGYTDYYDANENLTTSIIYNDPAFGLETTRAFYDVPAGTFDKSGSLPRVVTLPHGASNLVAWAFPGASSNTSTSIFALTNGQVIELSDEAYFIYVN